MQRTRPAARAWLAAALALGAAACSDRANPAAPDPRGGPVGGTPGKPIAVQALACTASRGERTVSCKPADPQTPGLSPDIIVGGQNVYVKVTSSNVAYNGGTGQFTFDVALQNLIEQPMGTTDGTTLDPNGVRVFFSSGPNVTSGTGVASVLPDGFATFTAPGQPYYQFNQVLAHNATSAAHTWTLIMPPTVLTFDFLLLVSAPVEYPNGYVTLDGQLPGASYGLLHPGSTHPLTAVVKSAVGNVLGGTVTFGSTDANCATVDAGGTVTGVSYATCSVTASSGGRPGSMSFSVTGTTRSWNGSASTDWFTAANWDGGRVPATADSAMIPTGMPNYPVLTGAVTLGGLTVQTAASVDVGAFDLTADADVLTTGTGQITGVGTVVLAGTGTVGGIVGHPRVTGSYSLSADLTSTAPVQMFGGFLGLSIYTAVTQSQ